MKRIPKNALRALLIIFPLSSLPGLIQAQIPIETMEDTLSRYNSYSRIYYQLESSRFSIEMLAQEKFLTHQLTGLNQELIKRKNVDPADLNSLSSEAILQEAYQSVESNKSSYFARKYDLWRQYQILEIDLQMDRIIRLKQKLFDSGGEIEKKRIFDYDLTGAFTALGDGEYELAIRLFDHLIDFYGYSNYDDLLFYRSEAYYSSKQYNTAYSGYRQLISRFPESPYFQQSLFRTLTMDFSRGDYQTIAENIAHFDRKYEGWTYSLPVLNFIAGAVNYQLGNYDRALEYFQRINADQTYYFRALYLQAHCYSYKADNQQTLFLLDKILLDNKAKANIYNEAAVFGGDILLGQNNPERAWGYYCLVPNSSTKYPRALIGKAVCHLVRGENAEADSLADTILQDYKNSEYTYLARCLKGQTAKNQGQNDTAAAQYDRILNDSGTKIGLADFLMEKLKIVYLLNELIAGETAALETGDEDVFNSYWKLRSETETMLMRAIYTEIAEVDPEFRGFIEEKMNVMRLLEEYSALSDKAQKTEDVDLIEKYGSFLDTLKNVSSMVQISGYGRIHNLPKYYKYTDNDFDKAVVDSLYSAVSQDLAAVEAELAYTAEALTLMGGEVLPIERAKMLAKVENIRSWRNELDKRMSASFAKMTASPELDLTRWSHVAFHKSMVPGSDYDDLKAKQARVKEIDKYLQALGFISQQALKGQSEQKQ